LATNQSASNSFMFSVPHYDLPLIGPHNDMILIINKLLAYRTQ